MKRLRIRIQFLSLVSLMTGAFFLCQARPASALPIFAKKYDLPCSACHMAFPRLNDFGIAFRDNGFQMLTERDTPLENPVAPQFAIRTTPIFTVETQTGVPTDQSNSDNVSTGTFDLTGVDLLSAGVLTRNISYLVVVTPFLNNSVDLESAWIRFSNIGESPWINLKLGKHELDIPFSEHRSFGLTSTGGVYLVNHYHPGGSPNLNQFEPGENEYGIELMGHDKGSRLRYVVDLNNGSNPSSNEAMGKRPNIFGHISYRTDQDKMSERYGLFADYGRWPQTYKTVGGTAIPGTGENSKPYSRVGGDLLMDFYPAPASQFSVAFQYLYGMDDGSLIGPSTIPDTLITCPSLASSPPVPCGAAYNGSAGGTQDAVFHGGSLELNWLQGLKTLVFAHFDRVVNKQQGDPLMPSDYNDQANVTLGVRYYLYISNASLVALHGEWSQLTTKKTNLITGEDQVTTDYLVGVDYAF